MGYTSISHVEPHLRRLAVARKVRRGTARSCRNRQRQIARGGPKPQRGLVIGAIAVFSSEHPGGYVLHLFRLIQADMQDMCCLSHGIEWAVGSPGPKENRIGLLADTGWCVRRPRADPIDFILPANENHRLSDQLNRLYQNFERVQGGHDWLETVLLQRLPSAS